MITISSIIPYISKINTTSSSLKKKEKEEKEKKSANKMGKEKEKEKKGRGKEEKEEERMRKRGRESEKEKEKKEEKEKEEEKMEKAILKVHHSLQNTFPSTKLGNNKTLIKGKLGKTQLPQAEVHRNRTRIPRRTPSEEDQALMLHHARIPVAPRKGKKVRCMSSIAKKSPFIRRPTHSENRTVVSNSPCTSIKDVRIIPRSGSQNGHTR